MTLPNWVRINNWFLAQARHLVHMAGVSRDFLQAFKMLGRILLKVSQNLLAILWLSILILSEGRLKC